MCLGGYRGLAEGRQFLESVFIVAPPGPTGADSTDEETARMVSVDKKNFFDKKNYEN